MSQYKLYTSGPYKQNNGTAITSRSTVVDSGAAKNISTSQNLNGVENVAGEKSLPNVVGGTDGVGAAQVGASLGNASPGDSDGFVIITFDDSQTLVAGEMVYVEGSLTFKNGFYRILSVVSPTVIKINDVATTNQYQGETSWVVKRVVGTFATQGEDNFIMMKNDATVHGQTNTKLASGASDYGRNKIAKFNVALKTTRVATAIRNGKYDAYSGEFDAGFPVDATDTLNADEVTVDDTSKLALKGELQYRDGGPNPTQKDYTAKTN